MVSNRQPGILPGQRSLTIPYNDGYGGAMSKEEYIEAGRIVNTHGVRGEVKIEVWLDSPDFRRRCGRIFLDGRARKILSAREQKQFLIAQLEGVEDLNAAIPLKGRTVFISRRDAGLPEGAYFLQDIIGAEVRDELGNSIGRLEDILERPASDVYVIRSENGTEHLIPAVPAFIRKVDADAGVITVHLIEGM